ncbi:MAG: hypothetical protein JNL82_12975 [Myxococcales bacterium]|nr:hypothetical protein [Myxococcales bacterium]
MLRLASARAWILAPLTLTAFIACNDAHPPAPTKIAADAKAPIAPVKPPPLAQPSPFYHPDREPPPPRSEPQLPPDQVAAALAAAAADLQLGDEVNAILKLRPCANKVPQSIRCEGELAMLLLKQRRHAAEARYFLDQSLLADDPALDEVYLRRFGAAMMAQGLAREASIAFERMMSRIKPTAADWYLYSTALQGVPDRLVDAAEAAGKAYALDPTHPEYLFDQAVLSSQIPGKTAQAISLLEEYRGKIKDPAVLADVDRRLLELRMTPPIDPAKAAALAAAKEKRKKTKTPG